MKDNCEICGKPAKYKLFKTNEKPYGDGSKVWIPVCDSHDREIGAENVKRAGGRK